jgi:23S rRNA (pseudouridine1915-N3)-methyltransferase
MMSIFAVGILKKSPELELYERYAKRMIKPVRLIEFDTADKLKTFCLKNIKKDLIVLDEHGDDKTTYDLGKIISPQTTFVIGAHDGVPKQILDQATHTIRFGRTTWPHLMVRVLLIEQLYRIQQIHAGHPYHRE